MSAIVRHGTRTRPHTDFHVVKPVSLEPDPIERHPHDVRHVNTVLATGEGTGAVSWLNYAFRLMYLPIGLFGVSIALDDFGAGFCNFRYLKILPIDYLKLDRSMLDGVLEDERDQAVLRAIIAMARALELEVLVEGVEEEAQRDLMRDIGCRYYQGFLRAKPVNAEFFLTLAKV